MRFKMFRQFVKNGFAVCSKVPKVGLVLVIVSSALGAGHQLSKELILFFCVNRQGRIERALPFGHPKQLSREDLLSFGLIVILHAVILLKICCDRHDELLLFCIGVVVEIDRAFQPSRQRRVELLIKIVQRRCKRDIVMTRIPATRGIAICDTQIVP